MAWLLAAGVVAVVIVELTSGAPPLALGPLASPAPAAPAVGVNVNYLFDQFDLPESEIDAQLAQLKATGATIARSDAFWELSEPSPPAGGVHHFKWTFDDEVASSLATEGLQWLPIVDYTVGWDVSQPNQDHSPPASGQDYAAYAGAFAARYGPGGSFWRTHPTLPDDPVQTYEIWNEPDNPAFWVPTPDAAAYAALYTRARDAIKRAQPNARVIVGGLLDAGRFVAGMLQAEPGLRRRIDGVAIHPYASDPAAVVSAVRSARQGLDALGMSTTPLYITEFGWTTHPAGSSGYASAAARPGYIEQTMAALGAVSCGLGSIILYTWVTPEENPADREDWYGINPPSGGGSADVSAFSAGLREVARPRLTQSC